MQVKTWEMIQCSVQGDIWYSEILGYPILHSSKGFISMKSKSRLSNIKASHNFLRATDWRKIN